MLREDFCGTAALSAAWLRLHGDNRAVGVDLDREVLDWARRHRVPKVGEAASRLLGVSMGEGRARAAASLDSGDALEAFRRMVEAQGGDPHVVDDPEKVLPAAPVVRPIVAERSGAIASIDAEALGRASGDLGAGRKKKGDPIDPAVGIVFLPDVADRLEAGQDIGTVHARTDDDAAACLRAVSNAVTVVDGRVEPPPLVHGWYG